MYARIFEYVVFLAILSNNNWHWKDRYDWHLTALSPVTTVFVYITYYMLPMSAKRADKCNVIYGRVREKSEGKPWPEPPGGEFGTTSLRRHNVVE